MIENTLAIESAHGYSFATLAKTYRRYEIASYAIRLGDFVPESHFLLGYIPQSELAVQTCRYEVAVVFGMKTNSRHNRRVMKRA